jgi:alpha-amylase
LIDIFLHARRHFAHGPQYDYFDYPTTIGWTRVGNDEHPLAMAVIMSNSWAGYKWMRVDRPGAWFFDLTGHIPERVCANADGWGEFRCNGSSVSVWVQEQHG